MITIGTQGLTHPHPGFAMHCVATREDWSRTRSLRYASLLEQGDIEANAERSYSDGHDREAEGATFLLTRDRRPMGTVRASLDSPLRCGTLPSMDAFEREIRAAIGLDSTTVEASLLANDSTSSLDRRVTLLHLLKGPLLICTLANADWLIIAVREEEIGFYRRMLNMEILSGAETYWGMAAPRVLMGLQYRENAALLFKRIPLLAVTDGDVRQYAASGFVRFADPPRRQHAA
jgi:hypothetical protein